MKHAIFGLCLAGFALSAQAEPISYYQHSWAQIQYQTSEKKREDEFAKLREEALTELKAHPLDADYLIWNGIISASYAGAKGGIGALKYVKEAKQELETAISVNPNALDGSAYTSLGSLYYKVPGWPIGFGDDEKAEQNLKQALQINPNGIDSNYFYGDFLLDQKRYSEAKTYLEKALQAAPRPERPVADAGRRADIKQALAKVEDKLK